MKELRKLGVTEYKDGVLELKLAPEAPKSKHVSHKTPKIDVSDEVNIDSDFPSQDDLLFAAVGGPPKEW